LISKEGTVAVEEVHSDLSLVSKINGSGSLGGMIDWEWENSTI